MKKKPLLKRREDLLGTEPSYCYADGEVGAYGEGEEAFKRGQPCEAPTEFLEAISEYQEIPLPLLKRSWYDGYYSAQTRHLLGRLRARYIRVGGV